VVCDTTKLVGVLLEKEPKVPLLVVWAKLPHVQCDRSQIVYSALTDVRSSNWSMQVNAIKVQTWCAVGHHILQS